MAEKSRKLTVYGATKGTHFQIQVVCKKNRLVITKAMENAG